MATRKPFHSQTIFNCDLIELLRNYSKKSKRRELKKTLAVAATLTCPFLRSIHSLFNHPLPFPLFPRFPSSSSDLSLLGALHFQL
ncbi:unnamed protein product [Citrullus colocynthis]|uniref:Uncharacterized protein n=1 Tax=Citrullus colocynthis TaxID=252529 RepID=A0ABP0YIP7_9ROSI